MNTETNSLLEQIQIILEQTETELYYNIEALLQKIILLLLKESYN